jgi:CBS domain-containing protein
MVQNNIGLLVVCDTEESSKLAGVLSERGILKAIASGGPLPDIVSAPCTRNVITIKADSDVAEVAKVMNRHKTRRVVLVDGSDAPKGALFRCKT